MDVCFVVLRCAYTKKYTLPTLWKLVSVWSRNASSNTMPPSPPPPSLQPNHFFLTIQTVCTMSEVPTYIKHTNFCFYSLNALLSNDHIYFLVREIDNDIWWWWWENMPLTLVCSLVYNILIKVHLSPLMDFSYYARVFSLNKYYVKSSTHYNSYRISCGILKCFFEFNSRGGKQQNLLYIYNHVNLIFNSPYQSAQGIQINLFSRT